MIDCRFSYMVHLVCFNFGGSQKILAQGSQISLGGPGHSLYAGSYRQPFDRTSSTRMMQCIVAETGLSRSLTCFYNRAHLNHFRTRTRGKIFILYSSIYLRLHRLIDVVQLLHQSNREYCTQMLSLIPQEHSCRQTDNARRFLIPFVLLLVETSKQIFVAFHLRQTFYS